MPVMLLTPYDVREHVAKRAKAKRLSLNLSQRSLSERSGVSYGTLKKFERTGKISIESLLKIAWILDALPDFIGLFEPKAPEKFSSLDQLLKDKPRKRGRK